MLIADAIATYILFVGLDYLLWTGILCVCVCVCVCVELFYLSIGCMNYLETHQKRTLDTKESIPEEQKKLSIGNDESSLLLCPNFKSCSKY
jgi:hypothetical protein